MKVTELGRSTAFILLEGTAESGMGAKAALQCNIDNG